MRKKVPDGIKANTTDEKWRSLRAFRRAKGLCQFCAEKWSRDHKCADSVQLHALQEVFELFQLEDDTMSCAGDSVQQCEHLFCTLSEAALSGAPAPKTMCLMGSIQGFPVNILVDSGSSHSFISSSIAERLQGVSNIPLPMSVKVANGESLVNIGDLNPELVVPASNPPSGEHWQPAVARDSMAWQVADRPLP